MPEKTYAKVTFLGHQVEKEIGGERRMVMEDEMTSEDGLRWKLHHGTKHVRFWREGDLPAIYESDREFKVEKGVSLAYLKAWQERNAPEKPILKPLVGQGNAPAAPGHARHFVEKEPSTPKAAAKGAPARPSKKGEKAAESEAPAPEA